MKVEEAKRKLTDAVVRSIQMNGGYVGEADDTVNDASRDVVAAVAEEHGEAWLLKRNTNRDEERVAKAEGRDERLWKWDGGLVYNFGADAVVPKPDDELREMLYSPAWFSTMATMRDAVERYHAHVEKLGGVVLVWG
jgi:hypothetical protein